MQRNIVAWTAPSGGYPPFVAVNETDRGVDIQVRDENGLHALVSISKADWNVLRHQIIERGEV